MPPVIKLPVALHPLLRCPVCKQPLEGTSDQFVCINTGCRAVFPLVNGIPVLINEQRSIFSIDDFVRQQTTFFQPRSKLIQTLDRRLP